MNKTLQGYILIISATLIWGFSFVAQKSGMDYVGPHTFNFLRGLIACITLLPLMIINNKNNKKLESEQTPKTEEEKKKEKRFFMFHAVLNGLILFGGMAFQQIGLLYTDASKAGFITAMYIVLVPILGVFIRQKLRSIQVLCMVLATFGLYYLCIPQGMGLTFEKGDILVFGCSLLYAVQIHTLAYCSDKVDGVKLAYYQFVVMGILSLIPALLFEEITLSGIIAGAVPILYSGVLSSGIAYTFEIVALKNIPPMAASFIMSLESVINVFASIVLLGETLAGREALGSIIMFVAIILAQLPAKEKDKPWQHKE